MVYDSLCQQLPEEDLNIWHICSGEEEPCCSLLRTRTVLRRWLRCIITPSFLGSEQSCQPFALIATLWQMQFRFTLQSEMAGVAIRPPIPRIHKGEGFEGNDAKPGAVTFLVFSLLEKGQKIKTHKHWNGKRLFCLQWWCVITASL